MSLEDLPLTFVDYERNNTGRAWFHDDTKKQRRTSISIEGGFNYEPDHPDAGPLGHVYLLKLTGERITQKQAAALATILQRFARKGSILRGSQP